MRSPAGRVSSLRSVKSVQVGSVDGEGGCRRRERMAGKCVCCRS